MKKTIKTEKILQAYRMLNQAKYGKLDDKDKVKVWKIFRALKPVALQFESDANDAATRFKPEIDGGFDETLRKAQVFESMSRDAEANMADAPMGVAEYNAFIAEFKKYDKLVNDAIKEYADKEEVIEFEPLSEDSFGKLMDSNDWNLGEVCNLSEIICE